MTINYDDVLTLVRALDADYCDSLYIEVNGLQVSVERADSVTVPAPTPSLHVATPVVAGAHRVKAPAVGRLLWEGGVAPAAGMRVQPDTLLGRIDADGQATPVTAGATGSIASVRAFEDGELVAYGQWLLVVQPH